MAVVVDTDVLSYLFKGDTRGDLYRPHLAGELLVVSFMTVAELDRWTLLHNWGEARKRHLKNYLATHYVVRHSDRDLCQVWAEVSNAARRQGRPIDTADAWIAASALAARIPLVTHNPADFAGVDGLIIVSEAIS